MRQCRAWVIARHRQSRPGSLIRSSSFLDRVSHTLTSSYEHDAMRSEQPCGNTTSWTALLCVECLSSWVIELPCIQTGLDIGCSKTHTATGCSETGCIPFHVPQPANGSFYCLEPRADLPSKANPVHVTLPGANNYLSAGRMHCNAADAVRETCFGSSKEWHLPCCLPLWLSCVHSDEAPLCSTHKQQPSGQAPQC